MVLATNVAETSLTVPGIKYVIDPGFARVDSLFIKNYYVSVRPEGIRPDSPVETRT